MEKDATQTKAGLWSLLVVYLVWGSSFLAIRLAVMDATGFSPYTLVAIRTSAAGLVLLCLALATRRSLRVHWCALRELALSGILLWGVSQILLIWAAARVDSGVAALVFSLTPLWSILIASVRWRQIPPLSQGIFILTGFSGVALMLPVDATLFLFESALPLGALLASGFFWALGSVFTLQNSSTLPLALATGYQLLSAGIFTSTLALSSGESWPTPGPRELAACLYLVIFGTVVAYFAYAKALKLLPISWVMSFAYVNPLIAVILGAALLNEKMQSWSLLGMGIILLSVFGLYKTAPSKSKL